ncbi:hypothetical protein ZIOFF_016628 [Zingiber officinale]|uniref:Uncharacterized protein n=1 Tax=Zingiber officinale TaxID=94328 RepID=A0A8J5LVH6_ZINOF|nr:hypothetical protein ZIOFF_016628 [Zingiber officinale]
MTFDEVSMERSKSFVKALQCPIRRPRSAAHSIDAGDSRKLLFLFDSAEKLLLYFYRRESDLQLAQSMQELKNLRPQLYTAAEYCESSYLHNEQKQIPFFDFPWNELSCFGITLILALVPHATWTKGKTPELIPFKNTGGEINDSLWDLVLDNLKGYAVRALVNAVDHLGTVASKLTDLFEQQMFDVSIVESGISCLRQRSSTCQAYVDKEGRIQHQMSFRTLRHHKHYTLPSLDKTAISSMQMPPKSDVTAKPSSGTSGKSSSKTLSWHLATSGGTSSALPWQVYCVLRMDLCVLTLVDCEMEILVPEEAAASLSSPSANHLLAANGNATSDIASNKFGLAGSKEASKPVPAIKSLHGHGALQIYRPRTRSRSMLSVFFSKPKTLTSRNISVS